jgi:hypothetical protein
MRRLRTCTILVAVAGMLFGAVQAHTVPTAPGSVVQAIWRVHQFDFHFRAATGRYHSCETLHAKISGILEALGAQNVVVSLACSRSSLVDNTVARIVAVMPVEATPENVAAAAKFGSERRLVAALHGAPLPRATDLQRFAAARHTVEIERARRIRLGPEDCDLLRGMNEQILPHLSSVRVVKERLNCSSTHTRAPNPLLIVETLIRQPAQVDKQRAKPKIADKDVRLARTQESKMERGEWGMKS